MENKTISTLDMPREKWLEERRKGIGGSDAAAIMGLNPYKSPLAVYMDKTGRDVLNDTQSEPAYWGTVLEAPIAKRFAELHPEYKVRRNNHMMFSREYPFMLADIDREIRTEDGDRIGLEIKTVGTRSARYWENEEVPPYYICQLQHYACVTGFKRFIIVALIGGQTLVEREIPRDDDIISNLVHQEQDFWRHVVERNPVDWDGSANSWDILRSLYPKAEANKLIQLPANCADAIGQINEMNQYIESARHSLGEIEKQRDSLKQTLAAALGDAERGIIGNYEVSYKTVNCAEHTVAAHSYRKMNIKEIKPNELNG